MGVRIARKCVRCLATHVALSAFHLQYSLIHKRFRCRWWANVERAARIHDCAAPGHARVRLSRRLLYASQFHHCLIQVLFIFKCRLFFVSFCWYWYWEA